MLKKSLLTGLMFAIVVPLLQAQDINNPGFEEWEQAPFPNIYNIEFPTSWMGSDKLIADNALLMAAIGVTPEQQISQSADSHEGASAALIETKYLGDTVGNLPGVLANAEMTLNMQALLNNPDLTDISSFISFTGGTFIDQARVDTVYAWVKLTDANQEPAAMIATAMQITEGSNGQDTLVAVGSITHVIPPQGNDYTRIAAVLEYDANVEPIVDTLIIMFFSSAYNPAGNVAGNALLVDDVSIVVSEVTSVDDPLLSENNLHVYPNPSTGEVHFAIDIPLPEQGLHLSITDVQGRVVHTASIKESRATVDFTSWPAGLYLYTITDPVSGKQNSGKLSIQ